MLATRKQKGTVLMKLPLVVDGATSPMRFPPYRRIMGDVEGVALTLLHFTPAGGEGHASIA
jgi:hypothetical protein